MTEERDDIYQALEQRMVDWNAKAKDRSHLLHEVLETARTYLDTMQSEADMKGAIATALVLARLKMRALNQTPQERTGTVERLMRQLDLLEPALDRMQDASQGLLDQMEQAMGATRDFYRQLESIQGKTHRSPANNTPIRKNEAEESLDLAFVRKLESEIARLHEENQQLEESLAEARAKEEWQPIAYRMPERPSTLKRQQELLEKTSQDLFRTMDKRKKTPYERMKQLAHDSKGKRLPLGMILVHTEQISNEALHEALQKQQTIWNKHLGEILIEMGHADGAVIAQALAAQSKVPFIELRNAEINPQAVNRISSHLAHLHTCIPFQCDRSSVDVALANPLDLIALEDLEIATNLQVQPHVATEEEIRNAIKQHYPPVQSAKPANW